MKVKDIIKKILVEAAVIYTVSGFLLLLIFFIVNADLSRGLKPLAMILLYPFGIFLSSANLILQKAKCSMALRILCHYLLVMSGVWCFLFLPNKAPEQTAGGALVLFFTLTLLYAIIMAVFFMIKHRVRHVNRDEGDYDRVYHKES